MSLTITAKDYFKFILNFLVILTTKYICKIAFTKFSPPFKKFIHVPHVKYIIIKQTLCSKKATALPTPYTLRLYAKRIFSSVVEALSYESNHVKTHLHILSRLKTKADPTGNEFLLAVTIQNRIVILLSGKVILASSQEYFIILAVIVHLGKHRRWYPEWVYVLSLTYQLCNKYIICSCKHTDTFTYCNQWGSEVLLPYGTSLNHHILYTW